MCKKKVFITVIRNKTTQDRIRDIAIDNGLKEEDIKTLINIAICESRLKHDAIGYNNNGTKDVGVFQINDIHNLSIDYRLNLNLNIQWAIQEFKKNGLRAWYSSYSCWK